MLLSWTGLALLVLAGLIAWFLQDSLAARERANRAAMGACERLSLQFLDGTVAFARIGWTRTAGRLALRRTYVFDYTANSIERLQGFVVLTGLRVDSVGYASAQPAVRPATPVTKIDPGTPSDTSNVLDLEQWRTSHRRITPAPPHDERDDASDQRH
jgi:hypothetical protein